MAIDDNTLYGLTGAQIKELPGKIDAVKGQAKVLSSADYNWPVDNPASVALWLLEPGTYCKNDASIIVRYGTTSASGSNESLVTFIVGKNNTTAHILVHRAASSGTAFLKSVVTNVTSGAVLRELDLGEINDTLTSTSVERPLSAKQGKVLKDSIGDLTNLTTTDKTNLVAAINEAAAGGGGSGVTELTADDYDYPTTGTADGVAAWLLDPGVYAAAIGVKVYTNTTTSSSDGQTLIVSETTQNRIKPIVRIYESDTRSNVQIYGTIPASGQGSGGDLLAYRNIKQSAGNSTTNVMSQDATTSMVYADPSTRQKVQIGAGSGAGGNASVATGMGTAASHDGSIALGAYARTSATGEMNIGTSLTAYGYNSSNYRLLTGLYDPQSAHDAATKGYVDGLVGNVALALNAINNGGGN